MACVRYVGPFPGQARKCVMSTYYKKYEWSPFTQADLLKNGRNG